MAIYKMRFMFDWGSGVCLWSANQATEEKFGDYPIFASQLSISDELKNELEHLIKLHDEALNWDEPNGDLLWDDNQIEKFLEDAQIAYNRLCMELSEDYEIELVGGM